MTTPVSFIFEGVSVEFSALQIGLGGLVELTQADATTVEVAETAQGLLTFIATSRANFHNSSDLQRELSRLAEDPKIASVLTQALNLIHQGNWRSTARRFAEHPDLSFLAERKSPAQPSEVSAVGGRNLPRKMGNVPVYAQAGKSGTVQAMSEEDTRKAVTDLFNQGVALGQAGRAHEALEAYRKIFEVDPHATQREIHVLACLNMGAVYLREKDFDKAAYTLKHAIELDTNRLDARHNHAVALLGLGHSMMALHQWSIVFARSRAIREEVQERGTRLENLPLGLRQVYPKLNPMEEEAARVVRQTIDFSRSNHHYDVALAALEILLKYRGSNEELQRLKTEISAEWVQAPQKETVRQFETKELKALSKTVAYALRHAPWEYELELDGEGWVLIEQLVAGLNWSPRWVFVTQEIIERVVREASAGRFEIQGDKIRALYGHSLPGRVLKQSAQPPEVLYHGTDQSLLPSIFAEGLRQGGRQYVHLSATREKALEVARRKGRQPVILTIHTTRAFEMGIQFYTGNNMVWLSDDIPPDFFDIENIETEQFMGQYVNRLADLVAEKTVGIQGGGGENTPMHISKFHYFSDTNSATLQFTNWGDATTGDTLDIDADLKFDAEGQWIGLDLNLAYLWKYPRMDHLPSTEIPLQSSGVFCELEGNILRIRFKKNIRAESSRTMPVILGTSQNKITDIEFLFDPLVPDMATRVKRITGG